MSEKKKKDGKVLILRDPILWSVVKTKESIKEKGFVLDYGCSVHVCFGPTGRSEETSIKSVLL